MTIVRRRGQGYITAYQPALTATTTTGTGTGASAGRSGSGGTVDTGTRARKPRYRLVVDF